MSGLSDIGVRVEQPVSGNADAILHEVAELLAALRDNGEGAGGIIDLQGLPLTPGDYEALVETLSTGEVEAVIHAIGDTQVRETVFPGVWWITHYNVEGDAVADLIEVTRCPEVLKTHPDDVADSAGRLKEVLAQRTT